MNSKMKVGLVLSGGGALGAYHVGVVKALAEAGTQIHAISGASIGALNGAILASSPNLDDGVKRLTEIWQYLSKNDPLTVNKSVYIKLLLQAGLTLGCPGILLKIATSLGNIGLFGKIGDGSILSDQPLVDLMNKYLDIHELMDGLPLFVSLYPTDGGLMDIARCFLAELGLKSTHQSVFQHVQSLPANEQRNALLASAALPLLFNAREVSGVKYSDGGMGGWSTMQGNTPITPLIQEAGCTHIIVTHLSDGSLWNRHDFPDATILEIRPQTSLSRSQGALGGAKDLLGFTSAHIPSWIEQGYEDTVASLEKIQTSLVARQELRNSEALVTESFNQNDSVERKLASAFSRLK